MPQGDKRGSTWEFFDATYDGHWDQELQRGLGQLTDGKVGAENFKMGYDFGRGESQLHIHFNTLPRPHWKCLETGTTFCHLRYSETLNVNTCSY